MKKIIAVLVIFVCVGTALSAQINMSAGGGVLLDMSFGNGTKFANGDNGFTAGSRNISFGGYGFFDATYAEASISFAYGSLARTIKTKGNYKEEDADMGEDGEKIGSVTQLGITLLGKYPIDIGPLTVFPLAGIGYNMVLSQKDKDKKAVKYGEISLDSTKEPDESPLKWMSQFAILAGGGLDFDITSNLYLRGSVLLQLRFANKYQRDMVDFVEKLPGKEADDKWSTTLGFGPVLKVGVGYRF